ncbi:CRISPR-associated Csm3 family protein [Oscillochloris trichoides DG-6]|uniref:CRISPR-associated Csm3 family protein n=1 Tax=Oscillochloris trichoides DG-6 TaxID=765420 RepID=E1I9S9_9CHLR|nr:CRISPR-associated RAMP protein Csx7 [Oscillochloris trichoides]EFO81931.1 CRISPR-associated Csm3 family protein [Oscillochloris trichoides DG-6]
MPLTQTEPIYSFAAFRNRLTISGALVALTALRIGVGRDNSVIGNDLPVLRDVFGAPLLPGASLKGALRAQLEALLRGVHPDMALDLLEIEKRMQKQVADLRERDDIRQKRQRGQTADADWLFSQEIWSSAYSTMIDLTFGAPWIAGRLFIRDALVDRKLWFDQFEIRNGVGINRDTETAEDRLLYDYEVVPAGVRFGFELVLENAADWQLGMILLALRPWQEGRVQIGGFRSRGLGYVQLIDPTFNFVELHEQQPDDLLRILCEPALLEELGIAPAVNNVEDLKPLWYKAFRNELDRRLDEVSHA